MTRKSRVIVVISGSVAILGRREDDHSLSYLFQSVDLSLSSADPTKISRIGFDIEYFLYASSNSITFFTVIRFGSIPPPHLGVDHRVATAFLRTFDH
jgi:hypothetical protein